MAIKSSTDLRYIHQDHLTGTAVVTSDNGTLLGSTKYYPYGERRNSQGDLGTDKLFTGQRLDDTGLYYYGARYYDATIGRFISADTIVSRPADPQSFNRYSYVLNNPLKYIDPTGHQDDDPIYDDDPAALGGGPPATGTIIYDSADDDTPTIAGVGDINQEIVNALTDIYADPTSRFTGNWLELLDAAGFMGSPAQGWEGIGLMLASAILSGQGTRAGILAGIIGGGQVTVHSGGAVVYTGINPNSFTGGFMKNFLDGHTIFTLEHVILTVNPGISQTDLKEELEHVRQYDDLGLFFLPVYIALDSIFGYERNPLEESAKDPNWQPYSGYGYEWR